MLRGEKSAPPVDMCGELDLEPELKTFGMCVTDPLAEKCVAGKAKLFQGSDVESAVSGSGASLRRGRDCARAKRVCEVSAR